MTSQTPTSLPPLAMDLDTAAAATGLSVYSLRDAVRAGELVVHYGGQKKTKAIVTPAALADYIEGLPTEHPSERVT